MWVPGWHLGRLRTVGEEDRAGGASVSGRLRARSRGSHQGVQAFHGTSQSRGPGHPPPPWLLTGDWACSLLWSPGPGLSQPRGAAQAGAGPGEGAPAQPARPPAQVVCTLVAAFLHFFFLSSFCWVLTEAWQSYMAVTGRLRNRLIRKRFLCLGWGEWPPPGLRPCPSPAGPPRPRGPLPWAPPCQASILPWDPRG